MSKKKINKKLEEPKKEKLNKKKIDDNKKLLIIILLLILVIMFPSNKPLNLGCLFLSIWIYTVVNNKCIKITSVCMFIFTLIILFFCRGFNDSFFRYGMVRECYDGDAVEYIDFNNLDNPFKTNDKINTYHYHILLGKKVTFITIKTNKDLTKKSLFINGRSFGSGVNYIKKINDKKIFIETNISSGKYNKRGFVLNKSSLTINVVNYKDNVPDYILK